MQMRCVVALIAMLLGTLIAPGIAITDEKIEPGLESQIVGSIRQIEQHRLILRLSMTQIESLRNTLEQLRTAKPRDASAIQKASSQLALAIHQHDKAQQRVAEFTTRLCTLKATLPLSSVSDETLLASHLQGLHGLSLRRARVDHRIGALERQLRALRSQPAPDVAAIHRHAEALSMLRVERQVVHAEMNATISDFKAFSSRLLSQDSSEHPLPPTGDCTTTPSDSVPASSRSVVLNWSVPTSRLDGTPLLYHELQGYDIRIQGDSVGVVIITINEPLTTSYVFKAPVSGVYTFAIAARDALGQLGAFSAAASRAMH